MDGPEIFNFTIATIPGLVKDVLGKNGCTLDQIDLFVFHQANLFMLEHLRKTIGIPKEKFYIGLTEYGNTVSATIPIALNDLEKQERLTRGMKVMLVGFGVGLSWGATIIKW
jgi:3-oxoacyl-[acyl-carrier-protein] synthase-3